MMKLDVRAFALACGTLWGVTVFLATLFLIATGRDGSLISHLGYFYLGYTFSVGGAVVGLVWGFVDGAVAGGLLALLYNRFAR